MTGMATIFAELETAIEACTPDVRPAITFRRGPYTGRLRDMDVSRGDPDVGTRLFQVLEHSGLGVAEMNDTLAHFRHPVLIEVQYLVNIAEGRFAHLRDMVATDKDRLIQHLRPWAWSKATTAKQLHFVSDDRVSESSIQHFLYLVVGIDYRLGAQS